MNTLPLDLLRLLDSFSDYRLRSNLSLNYEVFEVPVRCNNLKEAIATDNWCYINTYFYTKNPSKFELVHEYTGSNNMHQYTLSSMLQIINNTKELMFTIDPNYGPPHSLFKIRSGKLHCQYVLGSLYRKQPTTSITLPLITHTPIVYECGVLRYTLVIGSICINDIGKNFVVIKYEENENIALIAPITFINSLVVKYDHSAEVITLHFVQDYKRWYNKRGSAVFNFDRFIFGNEISSVRF